MKIAKILTFVLALIGLSYLVLMTSIWVVPACEVITTRIAISPSNQHEANLVIEKCPDKNEPKLELRIFNKNTPKQYRSIVIAAATSTDVDLSWLSDKKLQVIYPTSLQLTQEPSELDNIQLVFLVKNSNSSFKRDALQRAP
jgi:hypothetical protein